MNSRDLKYFCSAYEMKNLSHAAELSFITPQGMSKAINKLESELEVALFIRHKNGLTPTVYGDTLYENSKELINMLDNIKIQIREQGSERVKQLNIAMTMGVIDYLSADFILDFQEQHPNIKLNLLMDPDSRVKELMDADTTEIGIIMGPVNVTKYTGVLFTTHRHCVIIPAGHPLAGKPVISYKDLNGERMAIVCREYSAYQNNMNRFLSAGVMPDIAFEVSEIETIHTFAEEGRGIGFTVDFAAYAHECKNAVVRPLEDETCKLESFLICKKGKILSAEAKMFYDYAITWRDAHKDSFFCMEKIK